MKRTFGFVVLCIIILQAILLIPDASSENAKIEWMEDISIEGSCSTENVRTHFTVNRTVVEILVTLTWVTNIDSADLDMWVENAAGHVANASSTAQMPELMRVREFSDRGRWTFMVVPVACGSSGRANYTANITLRNIVLPEFAVSSSEIEAQDNVTMSINSAYENITHYYFDFGDGTDSGWINASSITKTYDESGGYYPRAKVRYFDGTESDWVEAGSIEVRGDERGPDLLLIAQILAIVLVVIAIVLFLIFKKRKGV